MQSRLIDSLWAKSDASPVMVKQLPYMPLLWTYTEMQRMHVQGDVLAHLSVMQAQKIKLSLLGCKDGLYSKQDLTEFAASKKIKLTTDCGIVKQDGCLYAILPEGELGRGAYGKVQLVQDIESGKLAVLKKQQLISGARLSKERIEEIAREEQILLAEFGLTPSKSALEKRKTKKGTEQLPMLMTLVEGRSPADVYLMEMSKDKNGQVCYQSLLSPLMRINMAINALTAILEMHQRGYVHCDIKMDNLIAALDTQLVKLIDVGSVGKLNANGEFVDSPNALPRGAGESMAPELRVELNKLLANEAFQFTYTEKTDAFAAGILLAYLFCLCIPENCSLNAKEYGNKVARELAIPHDVLTAVNVVVERLIKPDANERWSVADAIANLQKIKMTVEKQLPVNVGIFDLSAYFKGNDTQKAAIEGHLNHFDLIVMADTDGQHNTMQDYCIARWIIENNGKVVSDKIFISDDKKAIMEKMAAYFKQQGLAVVLDNTFCPVNVKPLVKDSQPNHSPHPGR